MGRRAKPPKRKAGAKRSPSGRSTTNESSTIQALEERLAESLKRERASAETLQEKDRALTAAWDQQAATSEILRIISRSPTDLAPVAWAIAEHAGRLCACTYAAVFRFDGELIHWVAARGASAAQEEALRAVWPRPADRETLVGRTILAGETLHIEDATSDPTYTSGHHPLRRVMPAALTTLAIRSVLNVPMLREGRGSSRCDLTAAPASVAPSSPATSFTSPMSGVIRSTMPSCKPSKGTERLSRPRCSAQTWRWACSICGEERYGRSRRRRSSW